MKTHKWIALWVCLLLLLSACGPGGNTANNQLPGQEPQVEPIPETGDQAETVVPELGEPGAVEETPAMPDTAETLPAEATEAVGETPIPETGASGEQVELRMTWYSDGVEGEVMRDLLDRFQEENPDITVVMDTVAYADLHDVLQGQVEVGQGPDLARITLVGRFVGNYLDLRPHLSDAAAFESRYPEAVFNSMRAEGDDGLYGMPTEFTVTGPFINRTLFEQAGVPVPSDEGEDVTWEEWTAAARQVAEATGTPYAIAMDRTGHRFWGPSLSNCATYINEDGSFTVDSEGFRETAQMLVDWHNEGITPAEVWAGAGGGYAAANEFFVNGELVMYMSGSWQVGQFTELIGDNFDWDVVPNPTGECGSTGIPGGAVLVAFQNTQHPEQVARLMEYLSQEEVAREFAARSMFLPAHEGLVASGVEYPASNEQMNVFVAEIGKLMPEAYALQYHPQTATLNTEIRDRLSQVIVGELTLDEAVNRIQQTVDSVAQPTQ